jgi:hypothetical protein
MALKLSEYEHLNKVQSPEVLCLVSVTGRHMDTDVRGQTNVEQREERAEVPVCLVLQADGVKERENGTASLGGKVP